MVAAASVFEPTLDELARLRSEIDALEAAWLAKLAEYERSNEYRADGFMTAAAAIRVRCRMTNARARASVRLGKRLERLPATAAAFADGEISRDHAALLAAAYTPERALELDGIETQLADAARVSHPEELRDVVRQYTDAIDGDGGVASDEEAFAKRRLHSSATLGGVVGDWFYDRESGELVNTAIDARVEADRQPDDTRGAAQARADALVEICRRSLTHDYSPPNASSRRRGLPHLSAVFDIRLFELSHSALVADIRAEAAHFGQLSRSTLERLSCDCEVSRVITDGASEVLDLGRSTRTIPPKLWKSARRARSPLPRTRL